MSSLAAPATGSGDNKLSGATLLVIAICSLAYLLDALVHSIMGPLAPELARDLALSKVDLGPVFSANLVGQCVGLVAFPLWAKRIGHRTTTIITLFGFGIFQALTVFAYDRDSLIVLRLITGFFVGGALPSAIAIAAEQSPRGRQGVALSLIFTAYGVGTVLAGVIGSLATGEGGWQRAMLGVGVACIASALVSYRWLPRTAPVEPTQDSAGPRNSGPGLLSLFARGFALGTLMLWLMFICMLTISYCLSSWLPTMMVSLGRDPGLASLSVSIFGVGGIVASLVIGPLIDRFGVIRVLVAFLVPATVLLIVLGFFLESADTSLLVILLALAGFFSLGAYGGINVLLTGYYSSDLRAIGVGVSKSVGRIGTVIAPILIGFGLAAGVEETTVMALFGVPAALTTVAVIVAGSTRPKLLAKPPSPR